MIGPKFQEVLYQESGVQDIWPKKIYLGHKGNWLIISEPLGITCESWEESPNQEKHGRLWMAVASPDFRLRLNSTWDATQPWESQTIGETWSASAHDSRSEPGRGATSNSQPAGGK